MTDKAEEITKVGGGKARMSLLKRLLDTVALPASRISPQDRSLAGDILLELLFDAGQAERLVCAKRLRNTVEAPRRLMRYLAQCQFDVAKVLLEDNNSYDASDLIELIRGTSIEHHLAIASRREVLVTVSEALINTEEPQVIRTLLNNENALISETGMDKLVLLSQQMEDLCAPIAARAEIRPAQAMAMFWWSDGPTRKLILTRHAADRMILIDQCSDIFSQFTDEDWADPLARKTLQMIERRQRNRAALERSDFENLEAAVNAAEIAGMTPQTMQEIGYLAGIKPLSMAKLMSDLGGEGIAVLCKATGLKRDSLMQLWKAMRRPTELTDGEMHPQLVYVLETFETLSVVKAQTVLRYWNWSLTASGTTKPAASNDADSDESFSSARRTAKLVFGS